MKAKGNDRSRSRTKATILFIKKKQTLFLNYAQKFNNIVTKCTCLHFKKLPCIIYTVVDFSWENLEYRAPCQSKLVTGVGCQIINNWLQILIYSLGKLYKAWSKRKPQSNVCAVSMEYAPVVTANGLQEHGRVAC